MIIRITAMLSHSEFIILQFSIMLLIILFGFSSISNLSYRSFMKSVYVSACSYHLAHTHAIEYSVCAYQQEIVTLHLNVEGNELRQTTQVRLELSLHFILVILNILPYSSCTLYSNCPIDRDSVHFPISLSYWMYPPADSILILSSPRL